MDLGNLAGVSSLDSENATRRMERFHNDMHRQHLNRFSDLRKDEPLGQSRYEEEDGGFRHDMRR